MKIILSSIAAFLMGTYGISALQSWAGKLPEINFEIPEEVAEDCKVAEAKSVPYTVWEYRDPVRGWMSTPAVNDCMVNYLVTESQLRGHRTMITRSVGFALMETGEEFIKLEKGKK